MRVPFITLLSKTENKIIYLIFKGLVNQEAMFRKRGYMQAKGEFCSFIFHVTGKMTIRLVLKAEMSFLT